MSETRAAWAGLIEVLAEASERFAGEDWMVVDDRDGMPFRVLFADGTFSRYYLESHVALWARGTRPHKGDGVIINLGTAAARRWASRCAASAMDTCQCSVPGPTSWLSC